MSLARVSLLDVIERAQRTRLGTVFSITPEVKSRQAVAVVLIAKDGAVKETVYSLQNGALLSTKQRSDH
jgi:hypothetical protein